MSYWQSFAGMPKFFSLMLMGPPAMLGVIQGTQMTRNIQTTNNRKRNVAALADSKRKQGIVERMIANKSNLAQLNQRYLERQLKTNSALRGARGRQLMTAYENAQKATFGK